MIYDDEGRRVVIREGKEGKEALRQRNVKGIGITKDRRRKRGYDEEGRRFVTRCGEKINCKKCQRRD